MKIRLSGADLLHADGQTDMTKVTVTLDNFANVLKTVFQDAVESFALEGVYQLG